MADDVAVSSPASCNWNRADVAAVWQVPQGGAALQVATRRPLVLPIFTDPSS
ncbi:hypothetical protein DIPPA_05967 [Diplonema papillatum]|nr:hypothetical protein DIPPA_05967 [Diplonema papillatum]